MQSALRRYRGGTPLDLEYVGRMPQRSRLGIRLTLSAVCHDDLLRKKLYQPLHPQIDYRMCKRFFAPQKYCLQLTATGRIDPAQVTPIMRTPQQVSSPSPAPDGSRCGTLGILSPVVYDWVASSAARIAATMASILIPSFAS